MKKAIVSVISDLYTDQRVNRTCNVLHDMGFDVLLVGRKLKISNEITGRAYKIKRFRLPFEKGFLFYASYNLHLFFYLLFRKADLLVANDLDTLLPNYLISRLKRIPVVYDSHEYFTGLPEIQNRPLVKKVWHSIERFIFPKLNHIITVNDSIATLYKSEYKKEITVVRNIPAAFKIEKIKSRRELGLPVDKRIILLQGSGINVDRGGEEAVQAMLPQNGLHDVVLYIIGSGDVIATLKNYVKSENLEERVIFIPKMPAAELFHYTANADVGLTLDKDTNINYRFSLPNKIFDYIYAGLPVLATSLVEVRKIVETFNIGLIAENCNPEYLAGRIRQMLDDKNLYNEWKKNLIIAAQKLNWETEKIKLIHVFEQFL